MSQSSEVQISPDGHVLDCSTVVIARARRCVVCGKAGGVAGIGETGFCVRCELAVRGAKANGS